MNSSRINVYTDEDVTNSVAEALKRRGIKAWTTQKKIIEALQILSRSNMPQVLKLAYSRTTWKIFLEFTIVSEKGEILIPGLLSLNKSP